MVAMSAGVTQLAECLPSKQVVAGSSPVSRSINRYQLLGLRFERGEIYSPSFLSLFLVLRYTDDFFDEFRVFHSRSFYLHAGPPAG